MQLRIQTRHLDAPTETRVAIERTVRLALGRHAAGVERAQITLSPSPVGRPASHCRIRARLRDGESLLVEDHAQDPKSAAAAAAWRLEHRMQRRHRAAAAAGASVTRRTGLR